MYLRKLGNTNIYTSIIGIGSSPFRHFDLQYCANLIETAMDSGINYYDTARSYKNGESVIAYLPLEKRQKIIIATKTGARGGKFCLNDLNLSIKNMNRKYIDIWMTHMIESEKDYEMCTALGGFCDIAYAAKQAGIVRATGASFHSHTSLILRAIEERAFDVVMFQFNMIQRETIIGSSIADYRDILLPAAKKNNIGIVVMKALAGGELSYGAHKLNFFHDFGYKGDEISACIKYVTMVPSISTTVVGIANKTQLLKNITAVNDVNDNMEDIYLKWTDEFNKFYQQKCIRCGNCLSVCPCNIEIPKVFRQYDQHELFGMEIIAKIKYNKLEIKADQCNECKKCMEICNQNFDIIDLLKKAHSVLIKKSDHTNSLLKDQVTNFV